MYLTYPTTTISRSTCGQVVNRYDSGLLGHLIPVMHIGIYYKYDYK